MSSLKRYGYCLGLIFLVIIILNVDIYKVCNIIVDADFRYVILSILASFFMVIFMVIRWQFILRSIGIKYKFNRIFFSTVKGMFLGEVTPGKVGEFYRVTWLVKDTDSKYSIGIFTIVLDRIYDLFTVLIPGTFLVYFYIYTHGIDIKNFLVVCTSIVVFVIIFLLNLNRVRGMFFFVLSTILKKNFISQIDVYLNEFISFVKKIDLCTHLFCTILSVINWFLKSISLLFFSFSLGINVPFFTIVIIIVAIVLTGMLPISISGFGTRESVFIFFLSFYNVPIESAVAVSLLYFSVGLFFIFVLASFVYFFELFDNA